MQNILQSLCTVIVGSLGEAVHIRFGHFCLSGQNALLQARHQLFCNLHTFHILRGTKNSVFTDTVFLGDTLTRFNALTGVPILGTPAKLTVCALDIVTSTAMFRTFRFVLLADEEQLLLWG